MRYSAPLILTGARYIRMQGEPRQRVDDWLDKSKLLENFPEINSIEIVGPHTIRLILFGKGDPVILNPKYMPLTLTEWREAFIQADSTLH